MNNNHVNHNLRPPPCLFYYIVSCSRWSYYRTFIHERSGLFCFFHTSPKIIYLQIGGNDGNDLSSTSSDIVANEVCSNHLPVSFIMAYKFQSLLLVNYCGGFHRQPIRTITTKSMQNYCI